MSERQRIVSITAVLFVVVMVTAIGLVYSKHKTRKLFVELQALNKEVVSLNNLNGAVCSWSRAHGPIVAVSNKLRERSWVW